MILFHVLFSHFDGEKRSICIKPNDNDLGFLWAMELKKNIDRGGVVKEPDRIYGVSSLWPKDKIKSDIEHCSEVINSYRPNYIQFDFSKEIDQEGLNILHLYFENIRRKDSNIFDFTVMPENVKDAINNYNILIHRLESHLSDNLGGLPRIVVSMTKRTEYELKDEHYNEFTMEYKPGDVCLNYTHLGKTLWDVFKDGDEITGEDNVIPQNTYSADFHIRLSRGPGIQQPFQEWLNRNEERIPQKGNKRSLGLAKVGRIINNQTVNTLWGISSIVEVNYEFRTAT